MGPVIKLIVLALYVSYGNGQDCTPQVNTCTQTWKASMASAKGDLDMQCSAVIVYGACLKNLEPKCSADEKKSVETVLNKDVLPILSHQCQAQACDVEFAGCTTTWKKAVGQTPDIPSKCKETEEYMTCLLTIESTCTADQIDSIRAVLNQVGPKVNKECRGQDCSVQTNMCIAVWNVSISDIAGNKELTCNANEAFDVCLRAIEVECNPDEKAVINNIVGKINPVLYSKCQGYGCTPMLYECVSKLNDTITAVSSIKDRCRAYQIYEQCLTNVQDLCNADEKNTVLNDLKIITPLVQQLCRSKDSGNGAGSVKPWLLSIILVFITSLVM